MTNTDPTSLYADRLVDRVAQALAIVSDSPSPSLRDVNLAMARQLLEMVGKDIALTGFALARHGWSPFGTYPDAVVEVKLHPEVDEAGMPLWGCPVELAREFASGEVMSQSDIDRPVGVERDLSGVEVLARMETLAAEWGSRTEAHPPGDADHEPSGRDWRAPEFVEELREGIARLRGTTTDAL